jgi:hypothetical protein
MSSIRLGVALLAVSFSLGCVTPQPRLARNFTPTATSAYVGALCKKNTMARYGFALVDESNKEYVVPIDDEVGLVQIPPGKYRVAYWTTFAFTGERITKSHIPANHPLGRPFDVGPGEVMFLGRWTADRDIGFGTSTFWLEPAKMTEAEAATAVRTAYPAFAEALVKCLWCKPR